MPSTKGVYSPSGISRVEKLMPGAITLKARQKPQNRYQVKFGAIMIEELFSPIRMEKTSTIAMIRE